MNDYPPTNSIKFVPMRQHRHACRVSKELVLKTRNSHEGTARRIRQGRVNKYDIKKKVFLVMFYSFKKDNKLTEINGR